MGRTARERLSATGRWGGVPSAVKWGGAEVGTLWNFPFLVPCPGVSDIFIGQGLQIF